ncbi:MAG: methyl-accepting chemotaxis protein [Magnetovibrio sp.]|nr:methyl-accepting chemotaxis protein [Magnetovibrio sp.]
MESRSAGGAPATRSKKPTGLFEKFLGDGAAIGAYYDRFVRARSVRGVSDGRFLLIGFASVTFLLLVVGVVGWFIVSGQNRSFDRFSAAGELLELMDDARLSELTYTRDETRAEIERTVEIADHVLDRARHLKSLVSDDERQGRLDAVIAAVANYKELFLEYVRQRTESNKARASMVAAAVRAASSTVTTKRCASECVRELSRVKAMYTLRCLRQI